MMIIFLTRAVLLIRGVIHSFVLVEKYTGFVLAATFHHRINYLKKMAAWIQFWNFLNSRQKQMIKMNCLCFKSSEMFRTQVDLLFEDKDLVLTEKEIGEKYLQWKQNAIPQLISMICRSQFYSLVIRNASLKFF